jgi:voltage-gated potassium channel
MSSARDATLTTPKRPVTRRHGNAYEIFILVLTIMSLVIMGLLLLPLTEPTHEALRLYDNLICIVFLADFAYNLTGSHPRREYLIKQRGWLDLLGSIPSVGGGFRLTALLRLARLSRLARITRLLGGQHRKELVSDVLGNRSQYATFITLLLVLLEASTASLLVLEFESRSPDANIKTGGDALWWTFVTLTTVGYGDHFPVTTLGRMTAVALMFAGVGVIGALASILASMLVSPAPTDDAKSDPDAATSDAALTGTRAELELTRAELTKTRTEMAELRQLIADERGETPGATLEERPPS